MSSSRRAELGEGGDGAPPSCQPWHCSAEESRWRSRDQLPGAEAISSLRNVQTPRPTVELGQVLPGGGFRDLKPMRGQRDGSSSDVGAEDLNLTSGGLLADGRHDAERSSVEASHSALPWIGTRTMVVCLCRTPAGRATSRPAMMLPPVPDNVCTQ